MLNFAKSREFIPKEPFDKLRMDVVAKPDTKKKKSLIPVLSSATAAASSSRSVDVILHSENEELDRDEITDNIIHILYNPIEGAKKFSSRINSLYVLLGENLNNNSEIINFLNRNKYYIEDEGEIEIVEGIMSYENGIVRKDSEFYNLIKAMETFNGSFSEYIILLLEFVLGSGGFAEFIENEFHDEFVVAFTDRSVNKDPLSNMELKEYLGDRALWSILTKYFVEKFNDITQNLMTSLHRIYASKQFQANISYSLGMFKFIKTNKPITVNTHEDLFEAFVGVLYDISFRLKANYGYKKVNLAREFVYKLYESLNLDAKDQTPSISLFNEYMRLFIKRGDRQLFYFLNKRNHMNLKLEPEFDTVFSFLGDKLADFKYKLTKTMEVRDLTRNKLVEEFFKEKVEILIDYVTMDTIHAKKNERNTSEWTDEQRYTLKSIMGDLNYTVNSRNIDGDWKDIYWNVEVYSPGEETIYTTEYEENADDVETLFYVIRRDILDENVEKPITVQGNLTRTDYNEEDKEYYLQEGKKYTINGPPSVVKKFIHNSIEEGTGKYFINMMGEDIEYSIDSSLLFESGFKLKNVVTIEEILNRIYPLETPTLIIFNYSQELYEFIGNRFLLTHGSRVLNYRLTEMDEHKLTNLQKYYFSKNIKKELQKVLGLENSFDYTLGYLAMQEIDYSECLINHIFMNIVIDTNVSTSYYEKVNEISRLFKDREDTLTNRFKIVGHDVYEFYPPAKGSKKFSVSLLGKNSQIVRDLFNKKAYEYLLNFYGPSSVSNERSKKFSKVKGFSELVYILQSHDIFNWELTYSKIKNREKYTLSYDDKYVSSVNTDPLNDICVKISKTF